MFRLCSQFLILLAFLNAPFSIAHANDADAKLEAANRYVKIFDFEQMMDDMTQQMARSMPADRKAMFIEYMEASDLGWMEDITVKAMVKHYTLEELEALADFLRNTSWTVYF